MGVDFCINVTVFVGLLVIVLGANHAVFLLITESLVVDVFRVIVELVTAG